MDNGVLMVNQDGLNESFVPKRLIDRKKEVGTALRCLQPVTRRRQPRHVWFFGRPGSGKTVIAPHILSRLADAGVVETAHLQCWRCNTLYKVADALVERFRILRAEQNSTTFKLERVRRHLSGAPLLVVLDDIDQTFPKDRDAIIQGLLALGGIGLICVSRCVRSFYDLRPSVRSRLAPRLIEIPSYSINSLEKILTERAYEALAGKRWTRNALRRMAGAAYGDARLAIHMLRDAAELAEREDNPMIRSIHVSLARNDISTPPRKVTLATCRSSAF